MSLFPASRQKLNALGYRWQFSRQCKLCDAHLEFWRTPEKKLAPLELHIINGAWLFVSHFALCPNAKEFRKPAPPVARSGDLFK